MTNHEHHLGRSSVSEPLLSLTHHGPPESLIPVRRVNSKVVHPPSMALVADHRRCTDPIVERSNKDRGGRMPNGSIDVVPRIIPRPGEFANRPKSDQILKVGFLVLSDLQTQAAYLLGTCRFALEPRADEV